VSSSFVAESMVLEALSSMVNYSSQRSTAIPGWVPKVKSLLYENYNDALSLHDIASELNIHPVYLCQQFPHYFNCSFGEYIRKIRIEKAVTFMFTRKYDTLTEIAYACGFADQSHFIRTFKKNIGIAPLAFKRLLK
jgi:AraC family transcriptional regulator